MRIQNAIGRNQVPQLPILRSGDFVVCPVDLVIRLPLLVWCWLL